VTINDEDFHLQDFIFKTIDEYISMTRILENFGKKFLTQNLFVKPQTTLVQNGLIQTQ
jgi:hypothetical protein